MFKKLAENEDYVRRGGPVDNQNSGLRHAVEIPIAEGERAQFGDVRWAAFMPGLLADVRGLRG
jgi:hypothetical protein